MADADIHFHQLSENQRPKLWGGGLGNFSIFPYDRYL